MKIKVNNKKAPTTLLDQTNNKAPDQVDLLKRIEKLEQAVHELQKKLNRK